MESSSVVEGCFDDWTDQGSIQYELEHSESEAEDSVPTTLDDDDESTTIEEWGGSEEENKNPASSSASGDEVLKPFLDHIELLLGNAQLAKQVLAHSIQKPKDLVGVALVLRGSGGAGMSILVNAIGKLHGSSYVHLSHGELASPFNEWMAGATLVFADEGTWRGGEDKLMALITDPTIRIEKICQKAETHVNGIHLVLACDHDWVAPEGPSARRFAVIDVNPEFAGDQAYFDRLLKSMEHPDFYALLHNYVNLEGF